MPENFPSAAEDSKSMKCSGRNAGKKIHNGKSGSQIGNTVLGKKLLLETDGLLGKHGLEVPLNRL